MLSLAYPEFLGSRWHKRTFRLTCNKKAFIRAWATTVLKDCRCKLITQYWTWDINNKLLFSGSLWFIWLRLELLTLEIWSQLNIGIWLQLKFYGFFRFEVKIKFRTSRIYKTIPDDILRFGIKQYSVFLHILVLHVPFFST